MQPHEERVVKEAHDLAEKLLKLAKFISKGATFDKLDVEDQRLLRDQRDSMSAYLDALNARIERFHS